MTPNQEFKPLALTYYETDKPDLSNSVIFHHNELFVGSTISDQAYILNGDSESVSNQIRRRNSARFSIVPASWGSLKLYFREPDATVYVQTIDSGIFRRFDLNEIDAEKHPIIGTLNELTNRKCPKKCAQQARVIGINDLFAGVVMSEGVLPSGKPCRIVCVNNLG